MASTDSSIFGIFDSLFDGPEDIVWDEAGTSVANGTPHFEHALEERGYLEFEFPYNTSREQNITGGESRSLQGETMQSFAAGELSGRWGPYKSLTNDQAAGMWIEGYSMQKSAEDYLDNIMETTIRRVPFFENPKIIEKRQANYVTTPIFLRNEPIRLWTGASPRSFSLELHYTLPHIAAYLNNFVSNKEFFLPNDAAGELKKVEDVMRELLRREQGDKPNLGVLNGNPMVESGATIGRDGITVVPGAGPGDGPRMPLHQPVTIDGGTNYYNNINYYNAQFLDTPRHYLVATAIQWMLNIFRSSVISAMETDKRSGPPLCRLKYGTIYSNTPTIVKSYKITLDPFRAQGMDHATLMARAIIIQLELEEFNQSAGVLAPTQAGGVPGWDTIMTRGHSDRI